VNILHHGFDQMLGFTAAGANKNPTAALDFGYSRCCVDNLGCVSMLPSHLYSPRTYFYHKFN
jgi:hypothetical protein